tara:strand:- start:21 stop:359 length:339 start_codon:yes stop_codon:yes gene_type:complete
VVASDGHSYERSAILSVLREGNGVSPLTREPLQTTIFPNRALKRRMQEHEEDLLRVVATAVANASDIAQQPGHTAGGRRRLVVRGWRRRLVDRASSSQAEPPREGGGSIVSW